MTWGPQTWHILNSIPISPYKNGLSFLFHFPICLIIIAFVAETQKFSYTSDFFLPFSSCSLGTNNDLHSHSLSCFCVLILILFLCPV